MGIHDNNNSPIFDTEAASIRQNAAQNLSTVPAHLHQMAVGATWPRSAEQSMKEYELLDFAAESIEILKALNIRDGLQRQKEASRKKKEEAPGVLLAAKYWVCPEELEKTKSEMLELKKRGIWFTRVEQRASDWVGATDMWMGGPPDFVPALKRIEQIINKVRSTATGLRTRKPDGHWATELLDFYSDGWLVWLDELGASYLHAGYQDVFEEKVKAEEQRAKSALEIVDEVEKEGSKPSFFTKWFI